MIGWFFRFCFRLRQSSFHWIISDGVVNQKWKRSDSSDSDSVELMTPLTTLVFDFHEVVSSLTTSVERLRRIISLLGKIQQFTLVNKKIKIELERASSRPIPFWTIPRLQDFFPSPDYPSHFYWPVVRGSLWSSSLHFWLLIFLLDIYHI